jgi:predicted DCC family thiol-disulfide oxidoreductase YuxK
MTPEPTASRDPGDAPATAVILFDGVCNLCSAWVRWVIPRDPRGVFRFASLQSQAAQDAIARATAGAPAPLPDSIVLLDQEGLHVESDAVLRIVRRLGRPYSLLAAAGIVPRVIRDAVYRTIARHRHRWFGRRDTCMLPSPETASRFLDAGEPASDPPR